MALKIQGDTVVDYGGGDLDTNIALGKSALTNNTTGVNNTAVGVQALTANTTGNANIAVGSNALLNNTTGINNTAVGLSALYANTIGYNNTAVGLNAGLNITNGIQNTAVGQSAGSNITTGDNNTCLGYNAEPPAAGTSNSFTLGNGAVSNLRCNDTSISSLSDARDKTNIEDIPYGLDFINALRPVKFDWNRRDGTFKNRKDLGFIAQELDEVEEQFNSHDYTRLVHKENPDKWEADPMKTYPILIKAIQELSAEVERLKGLVESK